MRNLLLTTRDLFLSCLSEIVNEISVTNRKVDITLMGDFLMGDSNIDTLVTTQSARRIQASNI